MRIEPEKSKVSIVIVGSLNAAIFHPSWFVANKLIMKEELESAKVDIIHRDLSAFKISDWLSIRVEPNRFIAETTEPPFIRLSDLVCRTFGDALTHTPITQLGINRVVQFSVGKEEIRNKIGKMLAPQEVWGEWAKLIEGKSQETRGGLALIRMRQKDLDDREKGHIEANIEPSKEVKEGAGILVAINDHYEVPEKESLNGAAYAVNILEKQFDTSIKRSEWIIDQVMALKDKV